MTDSIEVMVQILLEDPVLREELLWDEITPVAVRLEVLRRLER